MSSSLSHTPSTGSGEIPKAQAVPHDDEVYITGVSHVNAVPHVSHANAVPQGVHIKVERGEDKDVMVIPDIPDIDEDAKMTVHAFAQNVAELILALAEKGEKLHFSLQQIYALGGIQSFWNPSLKIANLCSAFQHKLVEEEVDKTSRDVDHMKRLLTDAFGWGEECVKYVVHMALAHSAKKKADKEKAAKEKATKEKADKKETTKEKADKKETTKEKADKKEPAKEKGKKEPAKEKGKKEPAKEKGKKEPAKKKAAKKRKSADSSDSEDQSDESDSD
jgi:hypothetical protein